MRFAERRPSRTVTPRPPQTHELAQAFIADLREIAYDITLEYGLVISVQTQTRERFEPRRETRS
jgi:hypothetical protein